MMSRTRSCGLVAGDSLPAVSRASSAEEDMFVESNQSTKVWCHTGGGEDARCAVLWCHNSREVDCLAAQSAPRESVRDYYVPIFGRLSGAQSANIGNLSGKTCHHTGYGNIEICEYDGLVVTLGRGRENNR